MIRRAVFAFLLISTIVVVGLVVFHGGHPHHVDCSNPVNITACR